MGHVARIHRHLFMSIALPCIAAVWWGCAARSSPDNAAGTGGTTVSASSGAGGGSSSSSQGAGGIGVGTGGGSGGGTACVSTSEEGHRIPVDIVFLVDRSGSMSGPVWEGTKAALIQFFEDPASIGVNAGMRLFPTLIPYDCDYTHYLTLDVPIAPLPTNTFDLANALPADAEGVGTPMADALKGALMAATAYQDAHPTHKVVVVLASDGDPFPYCAGDTIAGTSSLAEGALNYNGVRTYAIGVGGASIPYLNAIAAAGGTMAAYDVTQDISGLSAAIEGIRSAELSCDFEIPPPPNGQVLAPDDVNFTYMPQGMGQEVLLPRADDLADCADKPGWYYDSNSAPTKIILCPASCTTVQADAYAKVNVLFGCDSVVN